MKLETITIKDLFGYYSYDIALDDSDQLFIITGLNGSGKTTVMKILDNLSQGKLHYFYDLPFSSIDIKCRNENDPKGYPIRMSIVKQAIVANENKNKKNDFILDTNTRPDHVVSFSCFTYVKGKEKKVSEAILSKDPNDHYYPFLSSNKLYFSSYGIEDKIDNYKNVDKRFYSIETQKIGSRNSNSIPFTLYSSSLKVKFIEAQRLLISLTDEDDDKTTSKPTIKDIADKLEEHLKKVRYDFLDESQKKNKSLIDKLLSNSGESLSEEDYSSAVKELEPIVAELKTYNLATETLYPYNAEKKEILSVYIKDQKAKLALFSDLLSELNLFSSLLRKKKFSHKMISFSPQYGLKAVTDNGDEIDLEDLSSGEQNEIIILYKLIFDVPSDTILLIDEPEISLHVIWQEEFMSDLEEISTIRKQQMIIATHSPQIIGDRWSKCFDLTERNNR